MNGREIIIRYFEDFHDNKIAREVYDKLKENGFNPTRIIINFVPSKDLGETIYFFSWGKNFPKLPELEKILDRVNFSSFRMR